ncbi:DUF4185 domain-containing protein [Actinocrispum sp. NPDC049592]|uniref:DUF4185 domain-containing protein n=1 Tax=Actinocrispum sp. NPDC049592 TaxID=3154835 RepID=UPI00341AC5EB
MVTRRGLLVGAGGTLLGLGLGTTRAFAADELGVTEIARLTAGKGALNPTDTRWGVFGADLGHTFLHRGKIAMVFGDTLGGPAADDFWSVPHEDWRSNTMGWITPPYSPARGLVLSSMVTDKPGHAKELLASKKVDNDEQTVIPTFGASVNDTMYLHYMSVKHWGQPGHWDLNHSGLAYSDDQGQTWTKDPGLMWPADSNFGQVAIVESFGHQYFFGIPGGRYGGVQLARVRSYRFSDFSAYEYWNGTRWTPSRADAATIVPPNVGELSVRWNSYYRRWVMMYLDDPNGLILLRTASQLTGPWSEPQVVTTSKTYPSLYAPYILPLWNDGPDIYFTMSVFSTYGVFLLKTRL